MLTRSLLRTEEYKHLSRLKIDGKILDVGGSKKSGYLELIKGDHEIIVGNINASYEADVLFDAQEKWPFADSTFSGVLFVNVLEHLYDYKSAIRESYRVLNSGGLVVGVVPFMFNVHGSPSDYFRYTRFAIENLLRESGFLHIEIRELGSGAFSVIYHNLLGLIRWGWLARVLMYLAVGLDRIMQKIRPHNKMSAQFMPLGYYFEARK